MRSLWSANEETNSIGDASENVACVDRGSVRYSLVRYPIIFAIKEWKGYQRSSLWTNYGAAYFDFYNVVCLFNILIRKAELMHCFDWAFMLGTNEQKGVTEVFFAYTFILDLGHCT